MKIIRLCVIIQEISAKYIRISCELRPYKYDLPYKKLEFCEADQGLNGHTDISWWNTAACMLSDTDMAELLDGEGNYGYSDVAQEKAKRIRSLEQLTKKAADGIVYRSTWVYHKVSGAVCSF